MNQLLHKLSSAVNELKLDLHGKFVLTEAASGPYVVTPILAALAGAQVYALTKSTRYGTIEEVKESTLQLAKALGVENQIHIVEELDPDVLEKIDLVTNSGHLRPLNEDKLKWMKNEVAISLMFEAWEFRHQDLDIQFVRKMGMRIGATNERHPQVDVFGYLGDMALRLIQNAGLTPYRNRFVLYCNNDFGPYIAKTLVKCCDALGVIDEPHKKEIYTNMGCEWLSDFPKLDIPDQYRHADAIIVSTFPFEKSWVGNEINAHDLATQLPVAKLLRYIGEIDESDLKQQQIAYYPEVVKTGHMGVIPSEVGIDPVIRLQTGGLKVGELLMKNQVDWNGHLLVQQIQEVI